MFRLTFLQEASSLVTRSLLPSVAQGAAQSEERRQYSVIRDLKQLRRRRQQQQRQKTIVFMTKTIALHMHHVFSTFLWRPLPDYDVKPPKATLYGGRGHATTNVPFSIWTWIKPLRIQLQEMSPTFNELRGSNANRRDKVWKDANSLF